MRKALKPFAYLAALVGIVAPRGAHAETQISDTRTVGVQTLTVASGSNDNIHIVSTGKITPASGSYAVWLNSNNSVTNDGVLNFIDTNNSTVLLVDGGFTGSVINNGQIANLENYNYVDTDNDGNFDGPLANGSNRFGIHVAGASPFTGTITQGDAGTINVEGNTSAGIWVEGPLTGVTNVTGVGVVGLNLGGGISVVGTNSYGVRTSSTVVGGMNFTGAISATGLNATGVSLEGPISGQVHFQGQIAATGYRFTSRPTDAQIALLDPGDDDLQGGSAVSITGNVGGGVLFDAPPPDLDTNVADEDADGIADVNEGTSTVSVLGSAPAVKIGDGTNAITIGNVAGPLAYGVVNKGTITAVGVLDNIPTTGVLVQKANLGGGLYNSGTILAGSFHANSTALDIENLSTVAEINNTGLIQDNLVTDLLAPVGTGIKIGTTANVSTLTNSGSIQVFVSGEKADGVAVSDASNTLHTITNTGQIAVVHTPTDDANDTDDADLDPANEVITGRDIAFDLSAQTSGTTLTQHAGASGAAAPSITGEILFGSGADILNVQDGTITGPLSFGNGADQLLISGGSTVSSAITDLDGALAIDISDGKLDLRNTGNVTISSLNVGAAGKLFLSLDPVHSLNGSITVNGAAGATFSPTGELSVLLKTAIAGPQGVATPFTLITTTGGGTINGTPPVTVTDAPFLYKSNVTTTSTSVNLVLTRKTSAELGLNNNEGAFYEPFFQTALGDTELMTTLLGLGTSAKFHNAIGQAMPTASGSQVEFAATRSQALTSMLFSRYLSAKKPDREIYAWAHELSYSRDRETSAQDIGYDGFGFGFAFGIDGPMGRSGYKGLGLALSSDEINEKLGVDKPFTVTSTEVMGHVVQPLGGIVVGARVAAAYDVFRSKRDVLIDPDLDAPTLERAPKADWTGAHFSGSIHAAYPTHVGRITVRPEVGVDAVSMWEQKYQEKSGGSGLDLSIDSRQTTRANASGTLTLGYPFKGRGFVISPEILVGARAPLIKDAYQTTGYFSSTPGNKFTLASDPIDSPAAILGLALNVDGQIGTFRIEGQAEQTDGELTATGRLVLRLTF